MKPSVSLPIMSLASVLLPLLLYLGASPLCHGAPSHNITDILAAHPEFSEFSAALSSTGVAEEVNRRSTITVLAVDNAAMAVAQRLRPEDLNHAISLQVFLDYFDDTKLISIQGGFARVTSLYQAFGNAPGSSGIVNITTNPGGSVAFSADSSSGAPAAAVFYQKTVQKSPYDIAVLQVSGLIAFPAARVEAPAQAPAKSAPSAPATAPATPVPISAPAPAPAKSAPSAPATAPATRVPISAPATAPSTPAPASVPVSTPAQAPAKSATSVPLVAAPAPTPSPRPAPEPVSAHASSPDEQPADQKTNGVSGMASWTLGATVVAAALPAIVLVL